MLLVKGNNVFFIGINCVVVLLLVFWNNLISVSVVLLEGMKESDGMNIWVLLLM